MTRWLRVVAVAVAAIVLLGASACSTSEPQKVEAATAPAPAPAPLPSPRPVPATAFYVASGPIVVEDQVDVATQRGGVVALIAVDIGQPVRKGQLLAQLDDRELAADRDAADAKVRSAQANLQDWEAETKMAEADFRRAQGMRNADLNTQEELDHARYKLLGSQFEIEKGKQDLRNAQANLRALELELQKTAIRAPFDGLVARRYVRSGQQVAIGDRIFWVTAVRPLRVKFTLPEQFIATIRKGENLTVLSPDTPGVSYPARIILVSPVVDPSSGTFEVVAQIAGPAAGLRPGMTANIRLSHSQ